MEPSDKSLDLAAVKEQLASLRGPEYWRCLEELAQGPAFQELLQRESPQHALEWASALDRRKFLGLLGASLALAGLSGCAQAPVEHIMPYVRQPEGVVPGRPLYFATAMPLAGYANGGLLVQSNLGRPTKVEGNPDHPWSPKPVNCPEHAAFGPSDLFAQASILGLYDPDRSETVRYRYRETSSWENFRNALVLEWRRLHGDRDAARPRLRILTGVVTSPTLRNQLRRLLPRFPLGWHQYEPTHHAGAYRGAKLAFNLPAGRAVETHYNISRAKRIVALDSDFLACGAGHLRYTRDFAAGRMVRSDRHSDRDMIRLYVVESCPTVTGSKADHRLVLKAADVERFALALAHELGINVGEAPGDRAFGLPAGWILAVKTDLQAFPGQGLVIPGEGQSAVVHALAHAMNDRLGSVGPQGPVVYTEPIGADHLAASIEDLVDDMDAGRVDILIILGGNPLYDAPADLGFAAALERVRLRVHLSPYIDETSAQCHWHVPEAHYLESWGDVRAPDGLVSLIQPLIAPLYRGRTASEVLAVLTGQTQESAYEILRAFWRLIFNRDATVHEEAASFADLDAGMASFAGNFEGWWREALHKGIIDGTQAPPAQGLQVRDDLAAALAGERAEGSAEGLEIVFRPDPTVGDGQFANNGWLQELPKPLSQVTWGSVAFLSPATAHQLGLASSTQAADAAQANGKEVILRLGRQEVRGVPVWVQPGHADGSITVLLGGGRTRVGHVGNGVGYNAYGLVTSNQHWGFAGGLQATPAGRRLRLAATHTHHGIHGRENLINSASVQDYAHAAGEAAPNRHPRRTLSLYPERDYGEGHQWGMSIDLTLCTGCTACVIACQAENNIPVVGKEEVSRGREMHWLRIDTYHKGSLDDPRRLETYFQPVACVHCENAPCELVCPVEATVHSADGLNDMVYNRCVGTRYCSNNCPYKVRRFNFLAYADFTTEVLRLGRNPEVTVRSRGVMEKCTYCVQRIRRGEIEATVEDRPLRDGDVQTACQAACPAGAIVFGDLNDRGSLVRRLQGQPVNYGLLADQNTRPRTTYLTAFNNPNPALPSEQRVRG
jgi:MoCo/4Fe-4S cofactor protein with predicted Tat translocation signal